MKHRYLKAVFCGLVFCASFAYPESDITGRWITIDDDGETQKSIIELTIEDGELSGRVVEILDKRQGNAPTCKKCQGANKDQPILGMLILRNFSLDNNVWEGGYILDPETGKEYRCKLELVEGKTRLKVRGYLGFAFIGRTQFWEREPSQDINLRKWPLY